MNKTQAEIKDFFVQTLEEKGRGSVVKSVEIVKKELGLKSLSRTTLYNWKNGDTDFNDEWDEATRLADDNFADIAEDKLYGLVEKGNVRAIIFALQALRPSKWNKVTIPKDYDNPSTIQVEPEIKTGYENAILRIADKIRQQRGAT